jgi:hypothetical protein
VGANSCSFIAFFLIFSLTSQVNIISSVDGIHALTHVIINNLIQVDLVSHVAFFCGVAAIVVAQRKERLYCDHYPTNMFFLLAIEFFGCFH